MGRQYSFGVGVETSSKLNKKEEEGEEGGGGQLSMKCTGTRRQHF